MTISRRAIQHDGTASFDSDYRVSVAGIVVNKVDHTIFGGGCFGAFTGMVVVYGRNGVLRILFAVVAANLSLGAGDFLIG